MIHICLVLMSIFWHSATIVSQNDECVLHVNRITGTSGFQRANGKMEADYWNIQDMIRGMGLQPSLQIIQKRREPDIELISI